MRCRPARGHARGPRCGCRRRQLPSRIPRRPAWARARRPARLARSGARAPARRPETRSAEWAWLTDELLDDEGARPFRRLDLDRLADLRVHQGAADRRLGGEPAGGEVGLGRADQGPGVDAAGRLVEDLGGEAEGEAVGGRPVGLDDDGVVEPLAQAFDPRLEVGLVLFGDVVLGVLLEVAFLARDLDPRRHRLAAGPFEIGQLDAQVLEALRRDRLTGLLGAHRLQASRTPGRASERMSYSHSYGIVMRTSRLDPGGRPA